MAATERLIVAEETAPPAADPVAVVGPGVPGIPGFVLGAPSAVPRAFAMVRARGAASASPPAASGSTLDTVDSVDAERALLEAARRAVAAGAYDLALAKLGAHERQFPRGTLAADREWLKARVHSRRLAGSDR